MTAEIPASKKPPDGRQWRVFCLGCGYRWMTLAAAVVARESNRKQVLVDVNAVVDMNENAIILCTNGNVYARTSDGFGMYCGAANVVRHRRLVRH